MALPVLLLWAAGALAAGAAAGKAGQMVGNSKIQDAEDLQRKVEEYGVVQQEYYLWLHQHYMSELIKKVENIQKVALVEHGARKALKISPTLEKFIARVCAPWDGSFSEKTSSEIFSFTSEENRHVGAANLGVRAMTGGNVNMAGAAAATTFAFIYAKRGITYALDASTNYDAVSAWAHETQTSIDALIDEVNTDFWQLNADFKKIVTSRFEKAIQSSPVNMRELGILARMAEIIEETARRKLDHINAILKEMEDEEEDEDE